MANSKKSQSRRITRREFLKDAGIVIGGASIGSIPFLSSCGPIKTAWNSLTAKTTNTSAKQTTGIAHTLLENEEYTLECDEFKMTFGWRAQLKSCIFHQNKADKKDIPVFPGNDQLPIESIKVGSPDGNPASYYYSSHFIETVDKFAAEPFVQTAIRGTQTTLTFLYPDYRYDKRQDDKPGTKWSQMKVTNQTKFLEFDMLGSTTGCINICMFLVRFLNINYFSKSVHLFTGDPLLGDYSFNDIARRLGIPGLKDIGQGLIAGIIYGNCETVPFLSPDPFNLTQRSLFGHIYPPKYPCEGFDQGYNPIAKTASDIEVGSKIVVLGASSPDWLPTEYVYDETKRPNRFAFFICKERDLRRTIRDIETHFENTRPQNWPSDFSFKYCPGMSIKSLLQNNMDYWLVNAEDKNGNPETDYAGFGNRITNISKEMGIGSVILQNTLWRVPLTFNDTATANKYHLGYLPSVKDDVVSKLRQANLSIGLFCWAHYVSDHDYQWLNNFYQNDHPEYIAQISNKFPDHPPYAPDKDGNYWPGNGNGGHVYKLNYPYTQTLTVPEIMANALATTAKELQANWLYFEGNSICVGQGKYSVLTHPDSDDLDFYLMSRITSQIINNMRDFGINPLIHTETFTGYNYSLIGRTGTSDWNYKNSSSEITTDCRRFQSQVKRLLMTPDLGWFGWNLTYNKHPLATKLENIDFCRASLVCDIPMGLEFPTSKLEMDRIEGDYTNPDETASNTTLHSTAEYTTNWLTTLIWNTIQRRKTRSCIEFQGISGIPVTSPYDLGILKADKGTLTLHLISETSSDVTNDPHQQGGTWQVNSVRDHMGPVGDFDGDGSDEILLLSPAYPMVGMEKTGDGAFVSEEKKYYVKVKDIKNDPLPPNPNTGFIQKSITMYSWKGAIGIAKPDPLPKPTTATGIHLVPHLTTSTIAHDGQEFANWDPSANAPVQQVPYYNPNTWVLDTERDLFGPVGNFDGDKDTQFGREEILVVRQNVITGNLIAGPGCVGILKKDATGELKLQAKHKNGEYLGDWLLNTADNHFGPSGNFDKSGKASILVSSDWGIGVLQLDSTTNKLKHLVMKHNTDTLGSWTLDTAHDRFWMAADFDGQGDDEILVTNPLTGNIGILKWVYSDSLSARVNELRVIAMVQGNSKIGTWSTSNNNFGPAGFFDGSNKAGILVTNPDGIGILKLDSSNKNLVVSPIATNYTMLASGSSGNWKLDVANNQFGPAGNYDGSNQRKDSILISCPDLMVPGINPNLPVTTPGQIGILRLNSNNTAFEVVCISQNGAQLGNWTLELADNKFGFAT